MIVREKYFITVLGFTFLTSTFLFSFDSFCQSKKLKEGDLLFQQTDCGPFCQAINKVTEGIFGIDFNHVGIVIKNDNKQLVVLEAVSAGVIETPLEKFLNKSVDDQGLPKVAVGRLKNPSSVNLKAIAKEKNEYLGKEYDEIFDIENNSYYCSELVYFLFRDKSGKAVFELFPMTFIDPETGQTFEIWSDYYEKLKAEVPEGEPGLNPGGISRSNKINVFFPYSDFK